MIVRHVFIGLLLTLSLCLKAGAELITPAGIDPFRFEYELLLREGVSRQEFSLLPPAGPYFDWSSNTTLRYGRNRLIGSNLAVEERLRALAITSERFAAEKSHRPEDLPSILGGFAYRPDRRVGVISLFRFDREPALDPKFTGKVYRGMAGDIETGLLTYRSSRVAVIFGRSRFFWGPTRINLSLSESVNPLDLFSVRYMAGRLQFAFLFARLDNSRPDGTDSLRFPTRTFSDNRYLAGHRLDLKLHRRVRIGLFETVIFGGEGRPPELAYLNPLHFFHAVQLNEKTDDNTILGADISCLLGRGIMAYSQLLIDDFQIDKKTQGDQEPDQYGLMAGVMTTGRLGTLYPDIKAEYVRITNRTYHQRDPRNRYLYRGHVLGHPLGPDADSLAMTLRFWPARVFFVELEVAYRRRGEGSLDKPWDEPWREVSGDYDEPFPAGTVEKSYLLAIRSRGYLPFSRYFRDHFYYALESGWGEIHNSGNIIGVTTQTTWATIKIGWIGWADLSLSD